MIHQLDLDSMDKVDRAVWRLQEAEKLTKGEGLYICFSGGKDSCVIKALADMAGVKYDAHYSVTGIDPPELVRFVRRCYPDVHFNYPHYPDNYSVEMLRGRVITMWNLIPHKRMPPTMMVRYCCQYLKESNGDGRLAVTGVRWAESSRRKKGHGVYTVMNVNKQEKEDILQNPNFTQTPQGGVVLSNDNAEARDIIEYCYRRRKTIVNPIIDWETAEVWEFIREYKIPYCSLYDEGYSRLGCIGCPMGSVKQRMAELRRWPGIGVLYNKAIRAMLIDRAKAGLPMTWVDTIDVWAWWLKISRQETESLINDIYRRNEERKARHDK